jgi:hypothetical protein
VGGGKEARGSGEGGCIIVHEQVPAMEWQLCLGGSLKQPGSLGDKKLRSFTGSRRLEGLC